MIDGKKELKSGSGIANQKLETEVDISSLPDGENYRLQIDAVVTDTDETELTTSAVTGEGFSVKGHTKAGDGAKLRTVLDYTDSALEIDWSNAEESCDQWVIGVFQGKDTKEPVYAEQLDRDSKATTVSIDLDGEDLKVELSAMSNGKIVAQYDRMISLNPGVTVTIETPEQTGSTTAEVSYDVGDKKVQAEIAVGEKSQKVQWEKNGTAAFEIADMETQEICVVYGWETGSFYRVSRRISTDVVPPMLELYGVDENIRVKEKVLPLSGKTDSDATFKINGKEQKIGKDGTFQISLKLKKGENAITDRSRSTWESDIQNDSCTISEGRYKRGKSTASGRLLDFGRNISYYVSVCVAHGDIWNRLWQKRGQYKKNLRSGKRLLRLWNIGRDGWQRLVSVPLLETDREDFREKSDRGIKGGSGI